MFICNTKIKASIDGSIEDNTSGGTASETYSGDGGYLGAYVGLKIIVYNSSMSVLKSGIVVNQDLTAGYYTVSDKNKFGETGTYYSTSKPSNWYTDSSNLPSSYGTLDSYSEGLKTYLADSQFSKLKALVTDIGANDLSGVKYIVVEPLVYIQQIKYTTYLVSNPNLIKCNARYFGTKNANYKDETWSTNSQNKYHFLDWLFSNVKTSGYSKTNGNIDTTNEHVIYSGCHYISRHDSTSEVTGNYFLSAYEFYNLPAGTKFSFGAIGKNIGLELGYDSVFRNLHNYFRVGNSLIIDGNTKLSRKGKSDYTVDCISTGTEGCAIGWYNYNVVSPSGTLTIKKTKSDETTITR